MPIVVNVDVMLARRKMTSTELAEKIGLSTVNLSNLKRRLKGSGSPLSTQFAKPSTASQATCWNTFPGETADDDG